MNTELSIERGLAMFVIVTLKKKKKTKLDDNCCINMLAEDFTYICSSCQGMLGEMHCILQIFRPL